MVTQTAQDIHWLDQPQSQDVALVGGKVANLAHLAADFPVPPGFCVLATPDTPPPGKHQRERLTAAYEQLAHRSGHHTPAVAVRSSAVDEDGVDTSFAGQHDTFLNVQGPDAVAHAIDECFASFHTDRVRAYRDRQGMPAEPARSAVLVQQLVRADVSAVLFTANPVTGDREEIVINASWGLGESIVGGTVTPDTYTLRKSDLQVLHRRIADKQVMTVPSSDGTAEVAVPRLMWGVSTLTDDQLTTMAHLGQDLQTRNDWPVDLELAWDGAQLHLLQCRPVTT